jgi:hypothetical protein
MQDFEQRLRYCPDWGRIEPLSDAAIALDENQHSRARIGWSLLPSLALGSILRQENAMIKLVIGAALLVAITAPVLAQSSSTTTTTTRSTTSGPTTDTSETYYVVRDPTTRRCTVTTEKPSSTTTVVTGSTVYTTRTEAEGATKTIKVCTEE